MTTTESRCMESQYDGRQGQTEADLFPERLKLLIIMAKAYLKGYPLGDHRKAALVRNARWMAAEAGLRSQACLQETNGQDPDIRMNGSYMLHQRIRLLSIMLQSIASGYPQGEYRRLAMERNLDEICLAVTLDAAVSDITFLKVA